MSFGRSIVTVLRRYAEFDGRSGRPEFWWWIAFNVLVLAAIDVATGVGVDGTASRAGAAIAGLWGVATLLPHLAVAVRRLRDAGYGWTHLLWGLIPVAGLFILAMFLAQPTKEAASAATGSPAAA